MIYFLVLTTHVTNEEVEKVKKLIEVLQMRQSLLSETTVFSEDALCTICYARVNGNDYFIFSRESSSFDFVFITDVIFEPCRHQSCHSCIIQHLMSVKLCFYCKTPISIVKNLEGEILFASETAIKQSPDDDSDLYESPRSSINDN